MVVIVLVGCGEMKKRVVGSVDSLSRQQPLKYLNTTNGQIQPLPSAVSIATSLLSLVHVTQRLRSLNLDTYHLLRSSVSCTIVWKRYNGAPLTLVAFSHTSIGFSERSLNAPSLLMILPPTLLLSHLPSLSHSRQHRRDLPRNKTVYLYPNQKQKVMMMMKRRKQSGIN